MYVSTRGTKDKVTAATAIKTGMAPDGGLFVPTSIPHFREDEISAMAGLTYQQRAQRILSPFLTDYSNEEIEQCVRLAYTNDKFDSPAIAPLKAVGDNQFILELWHGPTSAFKDMALQLLPHLLSKALKITGEKKEIVILVATSGDTGKAALEGFRDVGQTRIIVFYPFDGVSEIQRLQMVTQQGSNVAVAAVRGNFDDAQTGVKQIFGDNAFQLSLEQQDFQLSSANSINWGRLVPQIVYYFSAYAHMLAQGNIHSGQAVNFVVPTGNFGNILAGYYAKLMGLPVNRLICASNSNNVLAEFLRTGVYDRRRVFYKTLSPSMDILISSNLERLLYHITGDSVQVAQWMKELSEQGSYDIGERNLNMLKETFWGEWVDDTDTTTTIREIYQEKNYLADPHTAVAWKVAGEYRRRTGDDATPLVILSTASPFKFNKAVLTAVEGADEIKGKTEFELLEELSRISRWPVPEPLGLLNQLPVRHKAVCDQHEMGRFVQKILQAKQ